MIFLNLKITWVEKSWCHNCCFDPTRVECWKGFKALTQKNLKFNSTCQVKLNIGLEVPTLAKTLIGSDAFEQEFCELSWAKLAFFRAEPSCQTFKSELSWFSLINSIKNDVFSTYSTEISCYIDVWNIFRGVVGVQPSQSLGWPFTFEIKSFLHIYHQESCKF